MKNTYKNYLICAAFAIFITARGVDYVTSHTAKIKDAKAKTEKALQECTKLAHACQTVKEEYEQSARANTKTLNWPRYYPEHNDEIEIIGELSNQIFDARHKTKIVRDSIAHMKKSCDLLQSEINLITVSRKNYKCK